MAKRRFTKMQMLRVRWHDSSGKTGWSYPDDGYPDRYPLSCETVGYLVRRSRKAMSLAQSVDEQGKVNDVMTIPKNCIVHVRRLRG